MTNELSLTDNPVASTVGVANAIPVAEPIVDQEDGHPSTEVLRPAPSAGLPELVGELTALPKFPRRCSINLEPGCYRISFRASALVSYQGTLRVEGTGAGRIVSGDLYRFRRFDLLSAEIALNPGFTRSTDDTESGDSHLAQGTQLAGKISAAKLSALAAGSAFSPLKLGIPIYPRTNYYSYLKVTGVTVSPAFSFSDCRLTLTAQEYVYAKPPTGSFDGSFPAAPGSRTVTIQVSPVSPAPFGFSGPYFEGRLLDAGVDKGAFTMGRVSGFVRRATVEVDTLAGAVAPGPVGGEDIRTVFATAGWDVGVVYDQVNVAVPAGVNANTCWSNGNLHALMAAVRNPTTNLDAQWRLHLIVVPAAMGCGRGVMYDQISVPREGVASFCNDGYPSGETTHYDGAGGQQQRNVPRAFLRSACHELGHGFNQVHQEGEGGADNSIMTTTPSVAGVIGAGGTFPDAINLAFNTHTRRHLMHWPDPVVRPGGHTFGSGHGGPVVPSADVVEFSADELELHVGADESPVAIGEPVQLRWVLTNTSDAPIAVPSDLGLPAQHARVTVTRPGGGARVMPSFVIRTDDVAITALSPGESRSATTRLFWSSNGFAFEAPGRHRVDLEINWVQAGIAFGVAASTDIWVDFPQSATDNDAAALLLDDEVGMYVALGGDAPHLVEAVSRLQNLAAGADSGDGGGAPPKALRGFAGLLPAGAQPAPGGGDAPVATAGRHHDVPSPERV